MKRILFVVTLLVSMLALALSMVSTPTAVPSPEYIPTFVPPSMHIVLSTATPDPKATIPLVVTEATPVPVAVIPPSRAHQIPADGGWVLLDGMFYLPEEGGKWSERVFAYGAKGPGVYSNTGYVSGPAIEYGDWKTLKNNSGKSVAQVGEIGNGMLRVKPLDNAQIWVSDRYPIMPGAGAADVPLGIYIREGTSFGIGAPSFASGYRFTYRDGDLGRGLYSESGPNEVTFIDERYFGMVQFTKPGWDRPAFRVTGYKEVNGKTYVRVLPGDGYGIFAEDPALDLKMPTAVHVNVSPDALKAQLGEYAGCVERIRVDSNYGGASLGSNGGTAVIYLPRQAPYGYTVYVMVYHGSQTIATAQVNMGQYPGDIKANDLNVISPFSLSSVCSK